MHDCRLIQERLIDLVFGETGPGEGARLRSELERCPECLDQYRSMTETLRVFDRASENIRPTEDYWPEYHQALRARLSDNTNTHTHATAQPFWRRLFGTSLRVPVPVAAFATLLLIASTLIALRTPRTVFVNTPAPAESTRKVETPLVQKVDQEKPLVQERVVTRTVYVVRNRRTENMQARRTGTPDAQMRPEVAVAARETQEKIESKHEALAGFKPTGEVKLRIIKGSFGNEK